MKSIQGNRQIILATALLAITLFGVGNAIGLFGSHHMVNNLLSGRGLSSLLIFKPTGNLIRIFKMVNSKNELERLSGYYALLDSGIIDVNFLAEQLTREETPAVKRTIIWLLSFAESAEEAEAVFDEVYGRSTLPMKREIIRSMKRLDEERYVEFIGRHNVSERLLEDVR